MDVVPIRLEKLLEISKAASMAERARCLRIVARVVRGCPTGGCVECAVRIVEAIESGVPE